MDDDVVRVRDHAAEPEGDSTGITAEPVTPMQTLEQRVRARGRRPLATLKIDGVPGFAVRYDPNIPDGVEAFNRWTELASSSGKHDAVKFNCLVLVQTAVALVVDGKDVATTGEPAFRNDRVQHQLCGVSSAAEAVRVWFGGEGHENDFVIGAHADEVLVRAGLRAGAESADGESPDPS